MRPDCLPMRRVVWRWTGACGLAGGESRRPSRQLMLAICLHRKYVTSGTALLPQHDFRTRDEDEMERVIPSSLPRLLDNSVFMMTAGKLLYFIDRGHRPLAVKIMEETFQSTTAFATSFAIFGQIRMLEGDFE